MSGRYRRHRLPVTGVRLDPELKERAVALATAPGQPGTLNAAVALLLEGYVTGRYVLDPAPAPVPAP